MHSASQVDRVRQQIVDTFVELGASTEDPLRETILIRDGYYCGRRFHLDDCEAIWFFEENQIKFYGPDGAVSKISLEAQSRQAQLKVA